MNNPLLALPRSISLVVNRKFLASHAGLWVHRSCLPGLEGSQGLATTPIGPAGLVQSRESTKCARLCVPCWSLRCNAQGVDLHDLHPCALLCVPYPAGLCVQGNAKGDILPRGDR